jgi:hypothetical protein
MYGIFRVKDDSSVIIDKNAVLLIPEITKISDKEIKYICLVYDWFDSPLRKMPLIMRKEMSKRRIWGNITRNVEKSEDMIKAIEAYKSICYEPARESVDAIRSKIHDLNKKITAPDLNHKDAKEHLTLLEFFEQKVLTLEEGIKREESIVEIKGKKKLSNLELWQRKQIQYRKINSAAGNVDS